MCTAYALIEMQKGVASTHRQIVPPYLSLHTVLASMQSETSLLCHGKSICRGEAHLAAYDDMVA